MIHIYTLITKKILLKKIISLNIRQIGLCLFACLLTLNTYSLNYCLERNYSLFKVKSDLKTILLADEGVVIDTSSNCIEIAVRPYRENLINKYMTMSYRIVSSKGQFSSPLVGQMCKIFLRKTVVENEESKNLVIGQKVNLEKLNSLSKESSTREILLNEGRVGVLGIDKESLYVKCKIFPSTYELELSFNNEFSDSLSTTISLSEGEWLNISSVSKDLSDKSRKISIHEIQDKKTSGEKTTIYFVSVKK